MAIPTKKTGGSVNFGELGFYSGGFQLPEGDYAVYHNVVMHQITKQDGSALPPRLGVMLDCYPLAGGEPMQHFLGMGTKADQTFTPSADGKGLELVPGGPAQQPNRSTNWALYLKSMYDSGLPSGVYTNDLTAIDGIHVHIQNLPEPEERKGFGAKTGEAAAEERKGSGLISLVTEIKETGKPWEGTGGVPTEETKAPAPKAGPKALPKPVAKPIAKPVAAAAPAAGGGDEDALFDAALSAITDILTVEANQNGLPKLLLRTGVFKAISAKHGAEMANLVLNDAFASDEKLNSLLGRLGFVLSGNAVKIA